MQWQQLIVDTYRRLSQEFEKVLDGLTDDDLHQPPAEGTNSIGWLCWHTTRSLDRTLGDVILGEQLWIKDGWHARFGRKPDHNDTGYGHSPAEAAGLKIPDIDTLREYHRAVMEKSLEYLAGISEANLGREFPNSAHPGTRTTLAGRLVGNINDCFQHVGQAAYARGILKGQGWLGR